jgi:DnaJ domain
VRDGEQPLEDPYRTLGLEPGASMAEVKRAYRHLAKAFHPDSAGEAALPRFLAIHEAYERLNTGRARVAARPSRTTEAEPWRADPERARAARERARSRRRGTTTGAGSANAGGPARGTGARATGAAGTGPGARTGGTGAGSTGTAGAASGAGGAASGSTRTGSTGPGGASRRGGGRRREVRKATLGSTSYDEARDPADATWSGASWYGPTSGEYWIVNPREYADPRKHGPGYQQRARRPPDGTATEPLGGVDADADVAFDASRPVDEPIATARAARGPAAPARTDSSGPSGAARPEASRSMRDAREWRANARPGWAAASADPGATANAGSRGRAGPGDAGFDPVGLFGAASRDWLGSPTDDPIRRLGLALVAWPPIGLAAAAAIAEMTGCAAYSAECGGSDPLLPWLAQAAILGLLLLLPPLARLFVGGTIAVLLALVPITAFLLVIGAGGAPQAGFALATLLALAWLGGVGWTALGGRRRRAPGVAL